MLGWNPERVASIQIVPLWEQINLLSPPDDLFTFRPPVGSSLSLNPYLRNNPSVSRSLCSNELYRSLPRPFQNLLVRRDITNRDRVTLSISADFHDIPLGRRIVYSSIVSLPRTFPSLGPSQSPGRTRWMIICSRSTRTSSNQQLSKSDPQFLVRVLPTVTQTSSSLELLKHLNWA